MMTESLRPTQVVVFSNEPVSFSVPGWPLRHLGSGDDVVRAASLASVVLVIGQAELAALTPAQIARLAERRKMGALKLIVRAEGDDGWAQLDDSSADAVIPSTASGMSLARALDRLTGSAPPSSGVEARAPGYAATLRTATGLLVGMLHVSPSRMVFVSRRVPAQGMRGRISAPSCPSAIPPVVVGKVSTTRSGEYEAELLLDTPTDVPAGHAAAAVQPPERRRVLLVDDSDLLISLTTAVLTSAGYVVTSTTNPFDARAQIRSLNPDLVLVDFNIPALRGDVLIEIVKRDGIQTPMVLYSSASDRVLHEAMTRSGAFAYIRKGVAPQVLVKELDDVYKRMGRA